VPNPGHNPPMSANDADVSFTTDHERVVCYSPEKLDASEEPHLQRKNAKAIRDAHEELLSVKKLLYAYKQVPGRTIRSWRPATRASEHRSTRAFRRAGHDHKPTVHSCYRGTGKRDQAGRTAGGDRWVSAAERAAAGHVTSGFAW
jgi:hypothetical protein